MPTGDGTNMLDRSFQERPETESEERGRLYRKRVERARQQRREKQNGFTQAEDVPVDTTTGVNSTTEPLTREQKLQELKLKRKQRMTISKEKAQKAIAERKRKLEELKRKRQQR
jgi:hypothetical protein